LLYQANLSNSGKTIACPLKLTSISIGIVTILSLVFPFDEHSTVVKDAKNVYAVESISPNKTAKLWDGTFDIVEKEKADECRNDYLNSDSSSLYRLMPISLHYNTIILDEGTFDFKQGDTPGCDDDGTPDYEDVLKKRKKKKRR
jgi:hypothetical protein